MELNKRLLKIGMVLCGIASLLVGVCPWINTIFNASDTAMLVIYEPIFYYPLLMMLLGANILNLIATVRQNKTPKTKWPRSLTVWSLGILMVSLAFAIIYPLTREAFGMLLAGGVALLIVIVMGILAKVVKGLKYVPNIKALLVCALVGLAGSMWFVGYSLNVDYNFNFQNLSELQSLDSIHAQHSEVARGLSNGVVALCDGDYEVVYLGKQDGDYGVFKCENNEHEYYFVQQLADEAEADYGMRVYGVTKNTMVEKVFAGKNYFFRDTVDENGLLTLNIALEAGSEDEFVERYTDDFYELIRSLQDYAFNQSTDAKQDSSKQDGDHKWSGGLNLGVLIFTGNQLDAMNNEQDRLWLLTHMVRDDFKLEKEYAGKYYSYWACAELTDGCALISNELELSDETKAVLDDGVMVLKIKNTTGSEITKEDVRQLLREAYAERGKS